MLAIVDHKGREEMYFCDFRKLRVLARGRSLEPLRWVITLSPGPLRSVSERAVVRIPSGSEIGHGRHENDVRCVAREYITNVAAADIH
jgi:hypothetical protein